MERHESLQSLSREHHQGLIMAQAIRKDAPPFQNLPQDISGKVKYTLQQFENVLYPHFAKEESLLYPTVRGLSPEIDKLFEQLFEEHHQMEEWVQQLPHSDKQEQLLDHLARLLYSHIRKEERQLFQLIQQTAPETMLEDIKQLL